jgi:hypothetical protein
MLTRSAVLLLVVFALACSDPTTTAPSSITSTPDTPTGMAPVTLGTPAVMGSCDGLPNVGNIVKVTSDPPSYVHPPLLFWVYGAIIRDNTSFPGVQFYCEDTNLQVDWVTFNFPGIPNCLTPIDVGERYQWQLQVNCGQNGTVFKAVAVPKNLAGTIISSLRDTTYITK